MKLDLLAAVCLGVGAALVTFAICLQYLILPSRPASDIWSREEAEALVAASMDYHAKSFDRSISEEELAAAEADYKANEAKLNAAKSRRSSFPIWFKYSGFAFGLLGAVLYIASKVQAEE